MHVLGKVFAFLVVVAAIVASILTAKVVQIRNSWTLKSNISKAKFAELKPKIEQLETQIDGLKNELFRSRELWGGFWASVPTNVINNADGSVQAAFGTDQGLRDKQTLYGFEVMPDGTVKYRGSFSVVAIQNNAANLKPNWRATPDEVKQWTPEGAVWRWRNAIPSGYQETADKQLLTAVKFEETLKARRKTLEGQVELLKKANESLKQREAELVGGDVLGKPAKVEPEFREGLVTAIVKTEEERNGILLKIDELRRKVREIQAEIEMLLAENIELVNRLPEFTPKEEVTQKVRPSTLSQKPE